MAAGEYKKPALPCADVIRFTVFATNLAQQSGQDSGMNALIVCRSAVTFQRQFFTDLRQLRI